MLGNPHRAEITSPLRLRGAQLSTPTYLGRHPEKRSSQSGGCEIMDEGKKIRKEKAGGEIEEERKDAS